MKFVPTTVAVISMALAIASVFMFMMTRDMDYIIFVIGNMFLALLAVVIHAQDN